MSITKDVWNALKMDLPAQIDLERNLINIRALARYIKKKYKIKGSMDSVISAARRYKSQGLFTEEEKELLTLFKNANIQTKTNITCITVSSEIMKELAQFIEKNGDMKIATGTNTIKIICDKETAEEIRALFPSKIEKIDYDMAEISVTLSEAVVKKRGVLARLSQEIALHGINIMETIISPPEFLIYVKEDDVIKTYESLLKLTQKSLE